ncbi:MAG: GlxA family transcriptional regulator [Sphingobacteriales bacterium]
MRIAVLNYEDAVSTCVTGPADILISAARMYPFLTGKPQQMELELDFIKQAEGHLWKNTFGASEQNVLNSDEVYNLVIIPAMRFNKIDSVIEKEAGLIEWIKQQHKRGADVASICIGAFILAATGLLDGKKATTNTMFAGQFRKMYPLIEMEEDKIIVDQGHIYSCGGAFSFTTFMIYIIEKFYGHEVAVTTSKMLMINMHQLPQSTFSIFQFQYNHADDLIKKAQLFIEQNYKEMISVEKLAAQYNMSNRNFVRRFELATSNTPLEYLQRVRVEAAKKLFENTNEGIEQVALECGYEDMGFFRKIFKRHVSMTPREYQKKYGHYEFD